MMEPLLARAIRLATEAHAGQTYPSPEREPYIVHPLRVMASLHGELEQVAGVLHDVVEDSTVTLSELELAGFPAPVVQAVDCLTRRRGEPYGNYIERVAGDAMATRVKLADLADNLRNNRRLPRSPDVVARIRRYEKAIARLTGVPAGDAQ